MQIIFQKSPEYVVFYDEFACTNVNLPLVVILLKKLLSVPIVNWNVGQCLEYVLECWSECL